MADERTAEIAVSGAEDRAFGLAEPAGIGLLWAIALGALGTAWFFPLHLALAADILILALFALSLDLVLGFAGIVSLGHAAFFGTGAYVAGLLALAGWREPLSGLLAAGVVAGLLGLVASFLLLRGRDLSRLMVTLGLGMMLHEAANKAAWLTGGADGLQGIRIDPIAGLFAFDLFGRTAFFYSLAVTLLVVALLVRLAASPFGLALRAIRANALRARLLGIDVERHLVIAHGLGAGLAGIAGGLLAQTTQFVSLDVLAFQRSAEVLLVLLLGGAGNLWGAVVGAVVFKLAHETLASITVHYWTFWLGAMLVVLVLFASDGMTGLARQLAHRMRRRAGARRAPGS
ncbi:MAG: branched-chain amino acid ABC transporter permease [Geminicoccaceae bacterium]|nr:branched-chain amino acid ABC transporter permease [Geminicoccaceae bacterium]